MTGYTKNHDPEQTRTRQTTTEHERHSWREAGEGLSATLTPQVSRPMLGYGSLSVGGSHNAPTRAATLHSMQQTHGNRAVQRSTTSTTFVQRSGPFDWMFPDQAYDTPTSEEIRQAEKMALERGYGLPEQAPVSSSQVPTVEPPTVEPPTVEPPTVEPSTAPRTPEPSWTKGPYGPLKNVPGWRPNGEPTPMTPPGYTGQPRPYPGSVPEPVTPRLPAPTPTTIPTGPVEPIPPTLRSPAPAVQPPVTPALDIPVVKPGPPPGPGTAFPEPIPAGPDTLRSPTTPSPSLLRTVLQHPATRGGLGVLGIVGGGLGIYSGANEVVDAADDSGGFLDDAGNIVHGGLTMAAGGLGVAGGVGMLTGAPALLMAGEAGMVLGAGLAGFAVGRGMDEGTGWLMDKLSHTDVGRDTLGLTPGADYSISGMMGKGVFAQDQQINNMMPWADKSLAYDPETDDPTKIDRSYENTAAWKINQVLESDDPLATMGDMGSDAITNIDKNLGISDTVSDVKEEVGDTVDYVKEEAEEKIEALKEYIPDVELPKIEMPKIETDPRKWF